MNSLISSPMPIGTTIEALSKWDATYSTIPLNPHELQFDPVGIALGDRQIDIDRAARERLFGLVGAPWQYISKLSPETQAQALSEHAEFGDFGQKPTIVMRDGNVVTIARGELFSLSNADVIRAVEEALPANSANLFVMRIDSSDLRLDIELVSPEKEIAVRPGDIVQAGLHIVHDRFGSQATLVEAFTYRLVCSNGMTRRECVHDGSPRMRTRKLPADYPNNLELQKDQVRRLVQRNWNALQPQLDAFNATAARSANVEAVLTRWLQRGRISTDNMLPRLLEAWRVEGGEPTYYGAINALTRVATHDNSLSPRQRRTLASLAGLLAFSDVHICQTCFSVLAKSATQHTHTTEQ